MTRTLTTEETLIYHQSTLTRDRAKQLVESFRAAQTEALRCRRPHAPTASYLFGDPEHPNGSYLLAGAYPDGSYRILTVDHPPAGPGIYEPTIRTRSEDCPPTVEASKIVRPQWMQPDVATHLVELYRRLQVAQPWPSKPPEWFRSDDHASWPTERVTGAYPDGSYLIESGGGWHVEDPTAWTHPALPHPFDRRELDRVAS